MTHSTNRVDGPELSSALPPRIELTDCIMRPWTVGDADTLRHALTASDAHLRAWTPWVVDGRVPGMSLEERLANHAAEFESGVAWVYGLFTLDESEVIGGSGLYPRIGPRAVELGYWVAVGHTGRGLATRTAAALTRLAFGSVEIDQVEIRCDARNVASARIPARLGYKIVEPPEGTPAGLQVWRLLRGELVDPPATHHRADG